MTIARTRLDDDLAFAVAANAASSVATAWSRSIAERSTPLTSDAGQDAALVLASYA